MHGMSPVVHGMSPVYEVPSWYPHSLKVLGPSAYWIPVLGPPARGIGTGRVRVLGRRLKDVIARYFRLSFGARAHKYGCPRMEALRAACVALVHASGCTHRPK